MHLQCRRDCYAYTITTRVLSPIDQSVCYRRKTKVRSLTAHLPEDRALGKATEATGVVAVRDRCVCLLMARHVAPLVPGRGEEEAVGRQVLSEQ